MRPEVKSRWLAWSAQFEGRVAWMYLDLHRDKDGNLAPLVTTGVGNLIDPVEAALPLPWIVSASTRLATPAEIRAEWQHIKAQTQLATQGYRAAGRIATLKLSDAAIDDLVLAKLDANDKVLAPQFQDWDGLPWQAQMAIHSMAWAMGPRFGYPHFRDAIRRRDWTGAATECTISEAGNPGVIARNRANRELLIAAASGQQAPAQSTSPGPAVRAPTSTGFIGNPVTAGKLDQTSPASPARAWWGILVSILRALGWRG